MNSYRYRAIDSKGTIIKGKYIVENESQLISIINKRDLYLIDYKLLRSRNWTAFTHKVTSKDLSLLCKQLYQVLKCGISLAQGLKILYNEKLNITLRNSLYSISNDIESGRSISESFSKFPKVFPSLMIQLIHVGEQSGNLEQVFLELSEYYVKRHKVNKKIGSMLMYPAIVFITITIIVGFIITKLVPEFVEAFAGYGDSMPSSIGRLMFLSELFNTSQFRVLMIVISISIYYLALKGYHKKLFYRFQYNLPIIKNIFLEINEIQFARNLKLLTNSGITIISSLEIIRDSLSNGYIKDKNIEIINSIRAGESLSTSLHNAKIFKSMFVHMIKVGEETGSLEEMLSSIADIYENNIDETISRITKLIEPAIIIVITAVILVLIFNLILPLLNTIYSIDTLG